MKFEDRHWRANPLLNASIINVPIRLIIFSFSFFLFSLFVYCNFHLEQPLVRQILLGLFVPSRNRKRTCSYSSTKEVPSLRRTKKIYDFIWELIISIKWVLIGLGLGFGWVTRFLRDPLIKNLDVLVTCSI